MIAMHSKYFIVVFFFIITFSVIFLLVPLERRTMVASDQNVVAGALKWARWRFGFNFSYFSIGFNLSMHFL